ncbi:unnamed protein product, partial [Adineta steineri]
FIMGNDISKKQLLGGDVDGDHDRVSKKKRHSFLFKLFDKERDYDQSFHPSAEDKRRMQDSIRRTSMTIFYPTLCTVP